MPFFVFSDRHQLVQQIQMIGGGALGQQAATAVRHVAAQNGVWSLGNFGGVPPKSAMMYHRPGAPGTESIPSQDSQSSQDESALPSKIEEGDYRHVFNSCTVAMVSREKDDIVLDFIYITEREQVFITTTSSSSFSFPPRRLHPWVGHSSTATSHFVNYPTIQSKKCAL